jgi:hypothetical protein
VSWLEVLAVAAIIGFVVYQQLAGQLLQGKRLIVLSADVTVVGFLDLRGHHLGPAGHRVADRRLRRARPSCVGAILIP